MALRRSSHNVYDTSYHLVWAPKYRKKILMGAVGGRMRELLFEIAQAYDISIEELEVSEDHVHIFCSFPPKMSITQVVTCLKSLSARAIFREYPQVKRQLWGGQFWEDGFFARTVSDKVTADSIKRYIQNHRDNHDQDLQLKLFNSSSSTQALQLKLFNSSSSTQALQLKLFNSSSSTQALQLKLFNSSSSTQALQLKLFNSSSSTQALQLKLFNSSSSTKYR